MNARRTRLLAAVLAVWIGVAWLLWRALDSAALDGPALDAAPSAESAATAGGADRGSGALAPLAAHPSERGDALAQDGPGGPVAARAPLEDRAALADTIGLRGRVAPVDGAPLEEGLVVRTRSRKGRRKLEHEAPVDPRTGRFEARLLSGARYAYVDLSGRFLFLRTPVRVKLAELPAELLLEPELGGEILVRCSAPPEVSDPARAAGTRLILVGRPRSGRGVWRAEYQRVATLGEDLTRRFTGLPPELRFEIQALDGPFVPHQLENLFVAAGETTECQIELRLGARVAGRVLGPDGEPRARAHLSADVEGHSGPSVSVLSGPDGAFDLRGIPPGETSLVVERDGNESVRLPLGVLLAGMERTGLEVRLESGGIIAGRIRWPDGSPAVHALVRVQGGVTALGSDPAAFTDEEGVFEISGLEGGPFTLEASARPPTVDEKQRRRHREPPWHARAEDVPPGTRGLLMTLEKGMTLVGTVVDDMGAPVTRFRITALRRLSEEDWGLDWNGRVTRSVRDEGGRFELEGLAPGRYDLSVESSAHPMKTLRGIGVPTAAEVRFVLARGASLSGIVLDASGAPVSGAEVQASVTRSIERKGEVSLTTLNLEPQRTGSDGAFRLEGIAAGTVELSAVHTKRGASPPVRLKVGAGDERAGLALTLVPYGTLEVDLDPSLGALAGRTVTLVGEADEWQRGTTDHEGKVTFSALRPGVYSVGLEEFEEPSAIPDAPAEAGRRPAAAATVRAGRTTHVTLGAPSGPFALRGRVTRGGEPVADLAVRIWVDGGRSVGTRTDAAGTFSAEIASLGRVHFFFGEGGELHTEERWVAPEQEELLEFELPGGSIRGLVVGEAGEALAGVQVELRSTAGPAGSGNRHQARVSTDEQGRFAFESVPAGHQSLSTQGTRLSDGRILAPSEPVEFDLGEGGHREDLRLVARWGGSIVVSIGGDLGEGDPPLVAVWQEGGVERFAWPDSDGRVRFEGLLPGLYRVGFKQMTPLDRPPGDALSVEVVAGRTHQVELVR